jgi:4-hydroxy-2-oxoheptanedioate aldolase
MNTGMRPSRVLRKLHSGGVVSCSKINLADPAVVQIAASVGLDCLWVDMEHGPSTLHDIGNQIRAAKVHDTDVLVRTSRGSYSNLIRPLEADAAGIMVPHVMSAEDAYEIVQQTRFHPLGRRPLDGGGADGAYCRIPTEEYVEQANRERFVVLQIEDPEPLEELDEIAETQGFDMLFFGPGDFTHRLGIPGRFDDPRVGAARKRIAEVAQKHGKFAGTVGSVDSISELIGQGYRFISVGADVVGLMSYLYTVADSFPDSPGSDAGSDLGLYSGKQDELA